MNWKGKRVLVTGAGGFIGSHLTELLVQSGANVRAFVHYNALGRKGWLDQLPTQDDLDVIAGDICDRDSVRQALEDVEIVFHLAALVAIPYSYRTPASSVRVNVQGTLNVLQASKEVGIKRFVHTSTSEVYGTAQLIPIAESHPLQAQSPYAASKIGADKLAEAFHLSYGLPVVIVRPFNTFGPRQSGRAVIPTIIAQCLEGGTVRLGNLGTSRDLNYVTDITEGFLLAGSSAAAVGKTFNLGSGKEISISELAKLIARLLGQSINIETEQRRIRPSGSEVERLLADSELASEILGWNPKVTLEEGLKRTISWMQKNMQNYRSGAYVL